MSEFAGVYAPMFEIVRDVEQDIAIVARHVLNYGERPARLPDSVLRRYGVRPEGQVDMTCCAQMQNKMLDKVALQLLVLPHEYECKCGRVWRVAMGMEAR